MVMCIVSAIIVFLFTQWVYQGFAFGSGFGFVSLTSVLLLGVAIFNGLHLGQVWTPLRIDQPLLLMSARTSFART